MYNWSLPGAGRDALDHRKSMTIRHAGLRRLIGGLLLGFALLIAAATGSSCGRPIQAPSPGSFGVGWLA